MQGEADEAVEVELPRPSDSIGQRTPETRGRHRISAEIKHLQQEARLLEEELDELGKMEKVTSSCPEFLHKVENKPDPLLPVTCGPINSTWERWFEGSKDRQGCRCWIL